MDHQYPTNKLGMSYGSALDAGLGLEPDLIEAYGTNGAFGYVKRTDLEGPMPNSPAEAVAQQAARPDKAEIPLYAQDGTTVVGTFVIDNTGDVQLKP